MTERCRCLKVRSGRTRGPSWRAAAEAIGRPGTGPAAQALVKMSSDSVRGDAVLSAMGNCRRLVIAQALAADALLGIFVRYTGPARQAASNALMVVDSPTTAGSIQGVATDAAPETRARARGTRPAVRAESSEVASRGVRPTAARHGT